MTDNEIGNLIRQIRYENGLSSREFGDKYNASFQSVARWERAKPLPPEEILKKICEDFDIDYDSLSKKKEKTPIKKIYFILNAIPILISFLTIILFFIMLFK